MFTGIIEELGTVTKITKSEKSTTFVVEANSILKSKKVGASIAINGACMTITKITDNTFQFDAIEESLKLTNLGGLKEGSIINLEGSLTLEKGIDGHLVQGHIDKTAKVIKLKQQNDIATLTVELASELTAHVALKGSITINGVSLTISDVRDRNFSVELIPHTLKHTNLKDLKEGDPVNIEIDLLSRYIKNLLDKREDEVKYEFLKDRNLI